eukprot:TRINITY_DN3995_c0_g1_i3.p1 TRINITY_DN3995_c0_g1~~TRINITY_DN3995_c0_g1_i3.p1  ORF type:complete len:291 (-),score=15.35 TRINITY_DN3995_c0_g1_i3:207-1079(-)
MQSSNFHDKMTQPTIGGFTRQEALELGQVANYAYTDIDANQTCNPMNQALYNPVCTGWLLNQFRTPIGSVHVHSRGSHIKLAYKGTDTLTDLATDFTFLPTWGSATHLPQDTTVHRGFMAAFDSTWVSVEPYLLAIAEAQKIAMSDMTFDITGHSLGAAQATIAMLLLATNHNVPASQLRLATFGSPRVFNAAGNRHWTRLGLDARTLRVAEEGVDPVTMVGPGFIGYKHVVPAVTVALPSHTAPHVLPGYLDAFENLPQPSYVHSNRLGFRRALWHYAIVVPSRLFSRT